MENCSIHRIMVQHGKIVNLKAYQVDGFLAYHLLSYNIPKRYRRSYIAPKDQTSEPKANLDVDREAAENLKKVQ